MKKILIYLFLLSPLWLTIVSCEKDNLRSESTSSLVDSYNQDDLLQAIAQVTAKAQMQTSFRSILLEVAKEHYGSEQTVFYIDIKDRTIDESKTVKDLLQLEAQNLNIPVSLFESEFLISQGLAKLSFTIYDGSSNNDLVEFTYSKPIPVVAEDRNMISSEEQLINAYDEELNTIQVSNMDDPEFAVLVIENNQSFVLYSATNGKSLSGSDLSEIMDVSITSDLQEQIVQNIDLHKMLIVDGEEYQLLSKNQVIAYINSLEEADRDRTNAGRSCNRDSRNGREATTGVNIVHSQLKTFCKWYKSNCNVEINTVYAASPNFTAGEAFVSNLPKKYVNGKRKDMKNGKNFSYFLPLYKLEFLEGNHGDRYTVDFVGKHHNPDGSSTFSIGLAPKVKFKLFGAEVELTIFNATYSTTKANNDTNLGGDLVQYCESIDIIPCTPFGSCGRYDSGSIKFWITKEN